eukprot:242016_1
MSLVVSTPQYKSVQSIVSSRVNCNDILQTIMQFHSKTIIIPSTEIDLEIYFLNSINLTEINDLLQSTKYKGSTIQSLDTQNKELTGDKYIVLSEINKCFAYEANISELVLISQQCLLLKIVPFDCCRENLYLLVHKDTNIKTIKHMIVQLNCKNL